MWHLDQRINDRGVLVDLDLAHAAIEAADAEQHRLAERTHALTDGNVSATTQRDALLAGMYFLDLMGKTGKSAAQLVEYLYSKVGPHYYHRVDRHFPADQRAAILARLEQAKGTLLRYNNIMLEEDNVPIGQRR